MKDDYGGKLSEQELFEVTGELSSERSLPLYSIGDIIYKQSAPDCFGSIIKRYFKNGGWIYQIMGSGTNPKDIAESEAALKQYQNSWVLR